MWCTQQIAYKIKLFKLAIFHIYPWIAFDDGIITELWSFFMEKYETHNYYVTNNKQNVCKQIECGTCTK